MMTNNKELKNIFKTDDKNGQIIFNALKEMLNKIDISNIDGIYIDEIGMIEGYLNGKVYISVDTKSPISDADFDVLFDTQEALEKRGFEIAISTEHITDALGFIAVY